MHKLDRITVDPGVFQGQPCIRDMRIPVSLVVKLVSAGKTTDEIIADLRQALDSAATPAKASTKLGVG